MGCRITFFSSGVALTLDADHASCASFQFQQERKSATSHEFHGIAEFSRRSAPPHLLAPGQQLTSKSITAASRKRPKRRYGAFAIIFSAPPEDAFIDIKFFFFLLSLQHCWYSSGTPKQGVSMRRLCFALQLAKEFHPCSSINSTLAHFIARRTASRSRWQDRSAGPLGSPR